MMKIFACLPSFLPTTAFDAVLFINENNDRNEKKRKRDTRGRPSTAQQATRSFHHRRHYTLHTSTNKQQYTSIMKLSSLFSIATLIQISSAQDIVVPPTTTTNNTLLKTFKIYHALTPNKFTPRGTIQLSLSLQDGTIVTSVEHEENCLAENVALEAMDKLLESGGFYRVKVVDLESGTSVLASVPGCDIRRANFRYVLQNQSIHML